MSYSKLIDTNLTRAFNKLKDLAKVATVTKHTDVEFNFGSAEKTSSTQTISFKVVIISSKTDSVKTNTETSQILFKREGVGDLTTYDEIVIDGVSYKVGKSLKNDGYVALVTIVREL